MKTQTKTSIRSRLIRPLLIGALCVAPLAVRATPYATSLTNNAGLLSFRINESGFVTVISTNGSGSLTNSLGNRVAGLISTNVGNLGDFTVIARTIRGVSILTLTTVYLWFTPTTASAAFTATISGAGVQTSAVAGVMTETFNSPFVGNFSA